MPCSSPINAPTARATATPNSRLPISGQPLVATLATKAAKAPASIMPSMPMLMMPVRSQKMPQSAPRISGTLARKVKLERADVKEHAQPDIVAQRRAGVDQDRHDQEEHAKDDQSESVKGLQLALGLHHAPTFPTRC